MDDGALLVAVVVFDTLGFHKLSVAHKHLAAVYFGTQSLAGDLNDIFYVLGVDRLFAGVFNGDRNGMIGKILGAGGNLNKLPFGNNLRMNGGDGKLTLCQRAGFVENHRRGLGKSLDMC